MEIRQDMLVGELLDIWFQTYAAKYLKPSTHECYYYARRRVSKVWISIEHEIPSHITPIKFQEFLEKLADFSYSWSSINHVRSLYSKLFDFCIRYDICKINPAKASEIPSYAPKGKGTPLPKKDLVSIEQNSSKMKLFDLYTIQFLRYTGLRKSELFRLRWQDVNWQQNLLNVRQSKTKNGVRKIPLIPETFIILQAMQKSNKKSKYVFCQNNNKPLTKEALNGICNRVAEIADIKKLTPHMLRHTLATSLLENKVDYKSISQLLGHKSVAFTMQTYVHHDIDFLRSSLLKISQNKKSHASF